MLKLHSSQKPTRKLAASALKYSDGMKVLAASLQVGFRDELYLSLAKSNDLFLGFKIFDEGKRQLTIDNALATKVKVRLPCFSTILFF